jgi:hypothetical protein
VRNIAFAGVSFLLSSLAVGSFFFRAVAVILTANKHTANLLKRSSLVMIGASRPQV